MKISKKRVKEIIKEELVRMNETTVRLSTMKDANFVPGQFVQLVGKKGMIKLDKKSKSKCEVELFSNHFHKSYNLYSRSFQSFTNSNYL